MRLPTESQWARYSALCAHLRPLPASERNAALQALRATGEDDPQVLSLVAVHFALLSDPDRLRTGDRLGSCILEEPLGAGGMGIVYRAQQHLGPAMRPVAVKLIHPALLRIAREEALARFLAELHTLVMLQHEHIARIYDGGIYEDPRTHEQIPYLAMELIRGGLPLTTYVQDCALSWQERLTLFLRVCRAVQYAHEHRVVHRDLKPANILVDSEGRPFVIDFGLAHACDALLPGAHLAASGTPSYMSPEQVSDTFGTVSDKSDVYALGLILYELLTGQPPYALPRDGSIETLRQMITEAKPSPLSHSDEAYRGELEAIMAMALAKRPVDRLSVAVLRFRLERHLQKLPPESGRPKTPTVLQVTREQHQQHLLDPVQSDIAGRQAPSRHHAGLTILSNERKAMARPVFISHASADKAMAEQVCQFLEDHSIPCWMAPRDVSPGAKYAEAIVNAIEGAAAMVLLFSEHASTSEHVLNEVERAVNHKTPIFPVKIDHAVPSQELAYFIARRHWLDTTVAPMNVLLAQLAEPLYSLTASQTPLLLPHASTTPQIAARGGHKPQRIWPSTAFRKKRLVIGVGAFLLLAGLVTVVCVQRLAPVGGQVSRTPDVLLPVFAYQTLEQGDWSQAETFFQNLVQQPKPEVRSQGYAGLAAVAFARGDAQQAFDFAAHAEALDPEIVYSHVIRGHILWDQGKLGAATAAYRTATEKTNGLPWQQAIAANRLGRLYAAEGFAGTALKYYDRAISQHPEMAVAYANKAHLLEQLGRPQEALGLYRQALQMAPEDRFTATLLREAERRQHLAKDPQQQARLAQHVATLLQAHEEGKPPESPHDDWTSTLLTLAFLHVQRPDSLALRAGEEEVLVHSLAQALRDSDRVQVLDQALLETLLVELQRHASDLADPQVALHVGRLLAARLLATGRIGRSGTEETLSISLLETTTGAGQARAEAPWIPDTLDDVVAQLSHALLAQMHQAYPLRGRILRINPQGVLLNIGSEHGVTPGLTMQIFGSEAPSATESHVSLIEVTAVEAQQSQARVLHHTTTLQEGWRVQESRGE